MPAVLLLIRIGKMPFPIPFLWFPIWLILFPVALLGQITGSVASLFKRRRCGTLAGLAVSMTLWSFVTCLHGLEVVVSSREDNLSLRFI